MSWGPKPHCTKSQHEKQFAAHNNNNNNNRPLETNQTRRHNPVPFRMDGRTDNLLHGTLDARWVSALSMGIHFILASPNVRIGRRAKIVICVIIIIGRGVLLCRHR
jgi:hypothetical protein